LQGACVSSDQEFQDEIGLQLKIEFTKERKKKRKERKRKEMYNVSMELAGLHLSRSNKEAPVCIKISNCSY
jgi:hypothetical protein